MGVEPVPPEQSLIDLGDLCHGLLNGDPSVVETAAAVARAPVTAAAPSPNEDDDATSPCWGGMLKGDASCCTPGFTSGKAHFKNKFCAACRKGIEVPASRVRAVTPDVQALYANSLRAGFWKKSAPALGGGEVRIANNTITCDGPWLIVYKDTPPDSITPCATAMPDGWADANGIVKLSVAKGTLVPLAEMGPKRPSAKLDSPNHANAPGFNAGPKRQRRAPSLPDVPPSELPPGGLPPSVRRGFSTSSAFSSGRSSEGGDGSPPMRPQSLVNANLPPLMVPSPSGPHPAKVGASLLSAASSTTTVASSISPTSPTQLATRLAAVYEEAATLLEQALRPLSPLRAQIAPIDASALLAQLNSTRAHIETCNRLARSVNPAEEAGTVSRAAALAAVVESETSAVPLALQAEA